MSEDLFVDVRYRGLELGSRLRMEDFEASQAYLHHPSPMPVGSQLILDLEGLEIPLQVSRVNEQVAGAEKPSGMYVRPGELGHEAQEWWDAHVVSNALASERSAEAASAEAAPAEAAPAEAGSTQEPSEAQEADAASASSSDPASPEAEASSDAASAEIVAEPDDATAKPAKAKKKRTRRKKRNSRNE